jgi:hypothetical protein
VAYLESKYKMAKKLFLNRKRAIPTSVLPSVSREEPDLGVVSSYSRNSPVAETAVQLPVVILD